MKEEHHQQEQRWPGRIEESEHRIAGEELADGIEIAHSLRGVGLSSSKATLESSLMDPARQEVVDARASVDDHAVADIFESAHEREQDRKSTRLNSSH